MATIKLTTEFCKLAAPPERGNRVFRCGLTRGLGLRVTASGHRAFVFNYTAPSGRERRLTIGDFGPWSLAAARKRANELRIKIDTGIDPLDETDDRRKMITLGELWENYSSTRLTKLSLSSQRDQSSMWRRHIEPKLGRHTKVADIRRVQIQLMVDKVTESSGNTSANRCHSYIRKMLNVAKDYGHIAENVASQGIDRWPENPRETYLSEEEFLRLLGYINSNIDRPSVVAIGVLLLTGARRGEVLKMEWANIDFKQEIWVKPAGSTKRGRSHRIPLSKATIALLEQHRLISSSGKYVFPAPTVSGHLSDLKRAWAYLCKLSDISNVRLHDLRHTYASMLISKGHSLPVIGQLLGHSQLQTTSRYAHLYDEVLRAATEDIAVVL